MQSFKFYNKKDILGVTKVRRFETKLGEKIQVIKNENELEISLKETPAKYVVIGVPEDIGIRANHGIGGANTAWMPFLQSFLNIQSNDFLDGNEILVLGHFDFNNIQKLIEENAQSDNEKILAYRHAVNQIDDEVEQLLQKVVKQNKIPIVIGGGHNNAYPCIKGSAKGLFAAEKIPLAQINVMNLDAHADYRPMEGRHSGNAFRYADEDGYMEKYCVLGIHENYLTQNLWLDLVNNPFADCITFEDIFLHEKRNFIQAVAHATSFTDDTYCGIELDLDCIENTLSSAMSPVGITAIHARQYINFTALRSKVAYLHICEGATSLTDGRLDSSVGKLISYLVSDFVKSHSFANQ